VQHAPAAAAGAAQDAGLTGDLGLGLGARDERPQPRDEVTGGLVVQRV